MKILTPRKSRAIKIHILPAVVVGGCRQTLLLSQVRELFCYKTHSHCQGACLHLSLSLQRDRLETVSHQTAKKSPFLLFFKYVFIFFIWLHRALVAARGIFQLKHVGSSFTTRVEPGSPALGVGVLATGPPGRSQSHCFLFTAKKFQESLSSETGESEEERSESYMNKRTL